MRIEESQKFYNLHLDIYPQLIGVNKTCKQKQLEQIKIKEWEEKFDREQKLKEQAENLREQRLRQKELEKEESKNLSLGLEKFEVDKTTEN